MADENAPGPWTAPGSGDDVPSWESPSSATPKSTASTPSASSASSPASPPPPAAPAPNVNVWKPGIIMLRPLTFGEQLEAAFKAIRHNPKAIFLVPAGILLLAQVLSTVIGWEFWGGYARLQYDPFISEEELLNGSLFGGAGGVLGAIAGQLITWLSTTIVTAAVTVSAARSVLGERATVKDVMERAFKRLGSLLLLSVLTGLAAAAAVALWFFLLISAFDSGGGGVAGVLFLTFFVFLPLWVWIAVKLILAVPAIVLEDIGAISGIRRSWTLTRGRFWPILGIVIVAGIIAAIASWIISIPLTLVASFVGVSDPTGTGVIAYVLSQALATFVSTLLSGVFLGGLYAILYTDQRMRNEGFDLALQQSVQERQGR